MSPVHPRIYAHVSTEENREIKVQRKNKSYSIYKVQLHKDASIQDEIILQCQH